MGTISGYMEAQCDTCDCRFSWYCDSPFIFVNSRVTGTCCKCINEEDHDCYDEYQIEDDTFKFMGRKVFKK